MSCYIVSDDTIKAIAIEAARECGGRCDQEQVQKFADVLRLANEKAVNERYPGIGGEAYNDGPDCSPACEVTLRDIMRLCRVDPVVALKAIRCYGYQSCDWGDYETSAAAKIAQDATYKAIARLPGYEAAPWGLK